MRLPRLENKKKQIRWLPNAKYDFELRGLLATQIEELLNKIIKGEEISASYYQSEEGKGDRLVDSFGILHIHLGGQKSNRLVYAVQYEEEVIILAISDHRYVQERPAGKSSLKELAEAADPISVSKVLAPKIKPIVIQKVRKRTVPKK